MAGITFSSERLWNKNLELNDEKKILIEAASGRGKSTFVSYLYGTRRDFTGSIFINDKNISSFTTDEWSDLRQNKMSVVFQDLRLFPNETAWENIYIKHRLNPSFPQNKIETMIDALGMKEYMQQPCNTLSLGQQQRIAIIRSLVQPFELLIMDEPFSHLDENNTQHALEIISDRCAEQNATWMITSLGSHHRMEFDKVIFV